jgi:glycosyltransferase involved in cell wall biosynthesis
MSQLPDIRRAPAEKAISIATIYRRFPPGEFPLSHMAPIRWLRMSEQLARLGFRVDIISDAIGQAHPDLPNLRWVPCSRFVPTEYDVIKTLFHRGYDALVAANGENHPFIISKLGSVVGAVDGVSGVHFLGEERRDLYRTQQRIAKHSKYVTVLTEESKQLWEVEFGRRGNILMVPTGVDAQIPLPENNPYVEFDEKIALYVGTLYRKAQRHINLLWQRRLNAVGWQLKRSGIRLCLIGPGLTDELDPEAVTCLGVVDNDRIWDYQHFADVGIVLAQGEVQHNESSKIYYYLRSGLPVVSEQPVPNNHVIREAGLGLISDYGDDRMMADMIEEAVHREWPREAAIAYVLERHTWERRAQVYAELLHGAFGR